MTIKQVSENLKNCNKMLDTINHIVPYEKICSGACKNDSALNVLPNSCIVQGNVNTSNSNNTKAISDSPTIPINHMIVSNNYGSTDNFNQPIDGLNFLMNNPCNSEEATFNLTFLDKTICSFGPKDSKKVHLFLNFTEHLSVVFGWIFLTLINIWLLDGIEFRAEWFLLVILSIIPLFRAKSLGSFFTITLIHLILDAAAGTTVFHLYNTMDSTWLCICIDFYIYINTISSLRGFSFQTWLYVLLFTYMNYALDTHMIASGLPFLVSVHAIGHASYLGLGEVLVQIILLRNQNFSNPIFSYDKAEIVHKFQYLRMSGKLEKVPIPPSDAKIEPSYSKTKRKNQSGYRKNGSPKSKPPGDLTEESSILRPSMGEIVDSFELCFLHSTPTTFLLSWFIPIGFLYQLSKSATLLKDFENHDLTCSHRSHLLDELECPISTSEVMSRIEVIFRVNGIVWPHWSLAKDGNSVTIFGLVPSTPYKVTMSIIGFRSSALQIITKPIPHEPNMTPKTQLAYAQLIQKHTLLEQQLIEARKLKKEELLQVKKYRRNVAQIINSHKQEFERFTAIVHRNAETIDKVGDQIDAINDEIGSLEEDIKNKEQQLTSLQININSLENQQAKVQNQNRVIKEAIKALNQNFINSESILKAKLDELIETSRQYKNDKNELTKSCTSSESVFNEAKNMIELSEITMDQHQAWLKWLKAENKLISSFMKLLNEKTLEKLTPDDLSFLSTSVESMIPIDFELKPSVSNPTLVALKQKISDFEVDIEMMEEGNQNLDRLVKSEETFVGRLKEEHERMLHEFD